MMSIDTTDFTNAARTLIATLEAGKKTYTLRVTTAGTCSCHNSIADMMSQIQGHLDNNTTMVVLVTTDSRKATVTIGGVQSLTVRGDSEIANELIEILNFVM